MNQIHRFHPLISFIYRTSIRPFHLSSIRSIEWSDIDEYTNKVNTSVFLTTDVYEKDGNLILFFLLL
jgi:hypothetical protein